MSFKNFSCFSTPLWIILCGLILTAEAHFNLFMNRSETMRLLGIAEELYYVRNGVVNDYALSFNLPIKSGMTDIFFNWQAVNQHQQQQFSGLYYSLSVSTSNTVAIGQPMVSIPRDGQVPRFMTVFRIRLLCSGAVKAEVDVRILMNVTLFSSTNVTYVEIRRRKMCLKGLPDAVDGKFHPIDDWQEVEEEEDREEEEEVVSHADVALPAGDRGTYTVGSSQIFYVGVGSTCGAILLITCSILVYYLHQRRANSNEGLSYSTSTTVVSHDRVQLKGDTSSRSTISVSLRGSGTPIVTQDLSVSEVRASLKEIAIDARHVTLTTLVAEGVFGRTYLGTMSNQVSDDESAPVTVLIKTITEEAPAEEEHLLLRNGCLTKGLRHQNLASILAAVLSASSSSHPRPLLIYPVLFNEHSLKTFLQRCALSHPDFLRVLNTRELICIAIQIAMAILHLHRRKITHRDIAARNCVMDGSLNVRLTDGALAHDLFPLDYQSLGDDGEGGGGSAEKERRPIKWLALEALVDRRYSAASDAWAFGVTLWELMTLGQQPYADVDPVHMATCLQAGYRMSQPVNCPNKVFGLMAWCWSLCPSERPRLPQLITVLEEIHAGFGQFV